MGWCWTGRGHFHLARVSLESWRNDKEEERNEGASLFLAAHLLCFGEE